MIKPRHQKIPAERISTAQTNKDSVSVQVLAGEALGASATIKTQTLKISCPLGLFVINPEAEIVQTLVDYRNGRMGAIDF